MINQSIDKRKLIKSAYLIFYFQPIDVDSGEETIPLKIGKLNFETTNEKYLEILTVGSALIFLIINLSAIVFFFFF